jgi:hypothetical protein
MTNEASTHQQMAHISGEIDHTGKVWRPAQPAVQEPLAWLYPEGLAALQNGKCWTAYPTMHDGCNIPIYTSPTAAVPDAITDNGESVEYRSGWNDCRQAMMEMMK